MPGKDYNPAMHTAEHILNSVMDKMFGCGRSFNSHIESKKSKCDYRLKKKLSVYEIEAIEKTVNEIINLNIPVGERFISREEADKKYFTGKLPEDAGDVIRLVTIGNFDASPCIGKHVNNPSEVGRFTISSADGGDGVVRIRFKLN